MNHFQKLLTLGLLATLLCGCAAKQALIKPFLNTQKEVSFKRSDYADPAKVVGGNAVVYSPVVTGNNLPQGMLDQAPLIIQGFQALDKKEYPADSDAIGKPEMKSTQDGGYTVGIDTEKPILYASTAKVLVGGVELTQWIYVFWYPRHPVGMVEKGDIDGGVLRVTLDAGGHPAIYEYVMGCGCWHGVFVGEHIESWAKTQFLDKLSGKKWCVEQTVGNEDNWKVRDIVCGAHKGHRPIIFISAGKHECLAVQTGEVVQGLTALTNKTYTLDSYDELDHLPVVGAPDKTASMFNSEGLVWGARRKSEENLFSNMNHGGWPRRLNAMKVHWDEESWNNPMLLSKFLRLPYKIIDPKAVPTVLQK